MLDDEKFHKFLQVCAMLTQEGSANIVIAQIDPDALGAAFFLASILDRKDCQIKIFFGGAVGHPQNRAIINKYDLSAKMSPISELKEMKNIILVDSSLDQDGRLKSLGQIQPRMIIDHHRGGITDENEKSFYWIEDVGSSCTMMTELASKLKIDFKDIHYQHIPILLALGIYTDTKALVSASNRDRKAYRQITNFVDTQELKQMIQFPLPMSYFVHLKHALDHLERKDSRVVTGIGIILPEEGDDIAFIADHLFRMEGVTMAIAWGIIGDTVRISARSSDLGTPLGDFLKKRFGTSSGAKLNPDGLGEGGALISFDLGPLMIDDEEVKESITDLVRKVVRKKVLV